MRSSLYSTIAVFLITAPIHAETQYLCRHAGQWHSDMSQCGNSSMGYSQTRQVETAAEKQVKQAKAAEEKAKKEAFEKSKEEARSSQETAMREEKKKLLARQAGPQSPAVTTNADKRLPENHGGITAVSGVPRHYQLAPTASPTPAPRPEVDRGPVYFAPGTGASRAN